MRKFGLLLFATPLIVAAGYGYGYRYHVQEPTQTTGEVEDFEAGLTPDHSYADGDVLTAALLDRENDAYIVSDVTFAASPAGVIWELGGVGSGAYVGVGGGTLAVRAGSGSGITTVQAARVTTSASAYAGGRYLIHQDIRITGNTGEDRVRVWIQPADASGLPAGGAVFVGESSASSVFDSGIWAGADSGAVGESGGSSIVTGEGTGYDGNWNGTVHAVRFYENQLAPSALASIN